MLRTLPLCIAIAAVLFSALPAPGQSDTSRRITTAPVRVSSETVDFGDVRPHSRVVRSATIVNDSDQRIRIRGVRVSCGCTVADWPESWIEPGESAEIELTFDSGDLWGRVQRYALLQFEGYNRPLRIMTVAHVNTGIRAEREYEPLGQTLAGTMTLHSTDGTPFRVLGISFAKPDGEGSEDAPGFIGAKDLDDSLAKPSLRHEVGFDFSTVDPDRLRRWVAVETDHPGAPVIVMHLDNPYAGVDRRRTLWIFGSDHLLLGSMAAGEDAEYSVVLRGLRSEAEIETFAIGSEALSAEVLGTEFDAAAGLRIRYRVSADDRAKGLIHTRLTVRAAGYEDTVELMVRILDEAPAEQPEPGSDGDSAG